MSFTLQTPNHKSQITTNDKMTNAQMVLGACDLVIADWKEA